MSKLELATFQRDIATHVMKVLRIDGVHRHIRFRRPGTMCMHFDLVTWPGYLAYTGDMGCYVFSRLHDMFEFFRRPDGSFTIDRRYWAEKVQASDKADGIEEFDPERFRSVINDYRVRWVRDARERDLLTKDERRELWEAVEDDVLGSIVDGEQSAFSVAQEFGWRPAEGRRAYCFEDLWEHRFTDYTHRFQWCCYALAWGIRKFDAEHVTEEAVA